MGAAGGVPTERQAQDATSAAPAVVLRLFAAARQAAGTGRVEVKGDTVAAVLAEAVHRYGEGFASVAAASRVWVNGAPAGPATALAGGDEVAVLPPVSGGAVPGGTFVAGWA